MKTVKLAKSIRFPGGPLLKQGSTHDIDDALFDEFVDKGVFVVDTPTVVEESAAPVEDVVESDTGVGVDDGASRPAKSAPVTAWREYADSLGVDTKGLSKAEIIAATA